jgi:O-antigen ligase
MLHKSTIRIIQIFSFVFGVFTTHSVLTDKTDLYHFAGRFFHKGLFHASFFTPFEIIWILLLVNLIANYRFIVKLNNPLLWFAFIAFAIRMINPNSETLNPILGMPLLSNLAELIFLFTFIVFIGLPIHVSKSVLEKMFYFTMIFAVIKGIILVAAYFAGFITTLRYQFAVILPETDNQMLFSFLGAMSFTLYLINQRSKYLFISLLFIGITFLSMQRSTALTGMIAIFLLLIFIAYKKLPMVTGKALLIAIFLIAGFQIVLTQIPDSKLAMVTHRYIGITKSAYEVDDRFFSDTGHREQSIETFLDVMQDNPFWGHGYGNIHERLFLTGQSTEIHNNFARIWAQHGIVTLLFYITVLIVIIRNCLRLMLIIARHNFKEYLMPLTVGFYLIGYFLAAWVSSGNLFFGHSRSLLFWFPMFLYLQFSLQQSNINYGNTKHENSLS